MDTYIGFDSAWAGNERARGAICAATFEGRTCTAFHPPELASFEDAVRFIARVRPLGGFTLIAIDQPTIVLNAGGMRPVEKLAASVISWIGGGVQPANRGRTRMFGDEAPIWRFLEALQAREDPEEARKASSGLFLMEVFPALALASLHAEFYRRRGAPKYNPANRKRFRQDDWDRVVGVAQAEAGSFNCKGLESWCASQKGESPKKADQDKLDAALCLLTALRWRLASPERSLFLGDLRDGYMVVPIAPNVRDHLARKAPGYNVCLDGQVPN